MWEQLHHLCHVLDAHVILAARVQQELRCGGCIYRRWDHSSGGDGPLFGGSSQRSPLPRLVPLRGSSALQANGNIILPDTFSGA